MQKEDDMRSLIAIISLLWVSIAFAEAQDNPCPLGARYYPTIKRCGAVQLGKYETREEKWRRETIEKAEAKAKKKLEPDPDQANHHDNYVQPPPVTTNR
jgi:hypothetical protein